MFASSNASERRVWQRSIGIEEGLIEVGGDAGLAAQAIFFDGPNHEGLLAVLREKQTSSD